MLWILRLQCEQTNGNHSSDGGTIVKNASNLVRIVLVLLLLLLFVGCEKSPAEPKTESGAQSFDASEDGTTQTEEYEYVKAELKDNVLSITILSEYIDAYPMFEENRDRITFDRPYVISGLNSTYTGFYMDTMGNGYTWPYLMLLTDRGTVEHVDIADQLFSSSSETAQGGEGIAFYNCGEILQVADIISFRPADISGEFGCYHTILAADGQNREYDLMIALSLENDQQEMPPSEERAIALIKAQRSEVGGLSENALLLGTGRITYIAEEYCIVIALNGMEEDNPRYAVSKSGCIYKCAAGEKTWEPANPRARLFGRTEYEELFAIITDPASPEYLYYVQQAQYIPTPAIGLEGADPVLLVSLKDGLSIEICLADYDSDTEHYSVFDSLNEIEASEGSAFEIGVQLSDGIANLNVIGRWNDGFSDYTAVWNAHREEGGCLSTKFITGTFDDPTFIG